MGELKKLHIQTENFPVQNLQTDQFVDKRLYVLLFYYHFSVLIKTSYTFKISIY